MNTNMVEKAKHYFLFLTQLYGTTPKQAKIILDKWFKDHQYKDTPSEFNKWYYENYPEYINKPIKNHR